MEQRWSLRKPVTFEVRVTHKCHPVVQGRSRNISLEGLFIETGIVILPVGSFVEVEFALMTGKVWEQIRMLASVVHRTEAVAGSCFMTSTQRYSAPSSACSIPTTTACSIQPQGIRSIKAPAAADRWSRRV